MSHSLDSDIAFFQAHHEALAAQARDEGKSAVLVHDRQVVGFYDSVIEAGKDGYRRFGRGLFLARSVAPSRPHPVLASIFSR